MRLSKTTASLLALGMTVLMSGCEAEQTEKDMLAEAQYCLDKANKDTAMDCMSKIQGLTAPKAYALRCAAGFIKEDITSSKNLAEAMTAISENSGAVGLLSAISFENQTDADTTFGHCRLSQQGGLALIGAMAKSATILKTAASLASCGTPGACSAATISDGIDKLLGSNGAPPQVEDVVKIVDSVSTVYEISCSSANSANSEMCKQIDSAAATANVDINNLSAADKEELGKKLLEQWKK